MGKIFFITGTDTNIGKTYVTVGLLQQCKALKLRAIGCKPIASGCDYLNSKLVNQDALLLQQNSTLSLSYTQVNPVALKIACAPSIAATAENLAISLETTSAKIAQLKHLNYDFLFIEGIGGWQVPINPEETMVDLVKTINCQVILVVGLRLGCINHAILTYQSIIASGLTCAGWFANCVDPSMQFVEQNIATIKQFIHAPCLGTIGYEAQMEDFLNIDLLTW